MPVSEGFQSWSYTLLCCRGYESIKEFQGYLILCDVGLASHALLQMRVLRSWFKNTLKPVESL